MVSRQGAWSNEHLLGFLDRSVRLFLQGFLFEYCYLQHPDSPGYLTTRLDPFPPDALTNAIQELCDHLTTTETRYPGTELTLRFEFKPKNQCSKH